MLQPDLREKKLRKGVCPICRKKRYVVEVAEFDVNAQLFIAKPLKKYFCEKCEEVFD